MTASLLPGRPFVARHAAVAAPHALAAAAGLRLLAQGGSAVDAMVATNAALGVLYPHMTGPGGDAFWLIHEAASGQTHVLNASGRAAAAATLARYGALGPHVPVRGPLAALTVPGAVDGWAQAHARFGRRPWADCLAPAIDYARDGAPVAPGLAQLMAGCRDLLASTPSTAAVFLQPNGAPYRAGATFRNPRLADTLTAIAEGGRDAFYQGPIARAVGEYFARVGGVLFADDFAAHRSDWETPIEVTYRGRRALNVPPPSQGFAALQILGILEHFDVAALAHDPTSYVDLVARATRLAYADRDQHLTDPTFVPVPLDRLLSAPYLAEQARALRAHAPVPAPTAPPLAGDTTFSCCVDAEGNTVGVIQSIFFEWGSAVVAGETGLLLQNRGCHFSLDAEHPNRLEPGKRTFHTLTAGLLLDPTGRPELVYGAMGGEAQPQTQAALVTRVVDHGLDVQAAVDAPRWVWGRTWGEGHSGIRLEGRFGREVAAALHARGHASVGLVGDWEGIMGHAQAIHVHPERLEAAADPRADGAALGY